MDGNFRLQNGLKLLSRIWTSRSKFEKAHKMILTLCLRRFSKSVVIFRKMHFLGLRKKSVFQEILTFSVLLSLVDHIIHTCIKTWLKLRLSYVFFKTLPFLSFSPENYAFHNRHFKVLLNRKSMSMQMLYDDVLSDTIAFRQETI